MESSRFLTCRWQSARSRYRETTRVPAATSHIRHANSGFKEEGNALALSKTGTFDLLESHSGLLVASAQTHPLPKRSFGQTRNPSVSPISHQRRSDGTGATTPSQMVVVDSMIWNQRPAACCRKKGSCPGKVEQTFPPAEAALQERRSPRIPT